MNFNSSEYLRRNLDDLIKNWVHETTESEFMEHYKTLTMDMLVKRGNNVYLHLVDWLESDASDQNTQTYFENVGAERFQEGFSLTEVTYAFYLLKKVLFEYMMEDQNVISKLNAKEIIEITSSIGNYFDLGNFYILRGFHSEMMLKIRETYKLSEEESKKIMTTGSLDDEELDSDDIVWRHIY